jgi:Icc protein
MPALIESSLSRRSFLKTAGMGAAIVGLGLGATARAEEKAKEFRVALISDTHIPADPEEAYRGYKPTASFKQITPEIVEWKPELVMHNGDAARTEGKVADYQALQTLLQPITAVAPICISMGNHDDRGNFATVFKAVAGDKQKVDGKNVMIIEHELLRFVVLDSLMYTNKVAGQLGKAQRTWLADYLPKAKDRPVVLFIHHTLGDFDGELADSDRLFKILEPHSHVKAIFYGHSHMWAMEERQGIKLVNQPAVGYPFNDKEPIGWLEGLFRADGVELTMHAFAGNTAANGKKFDIKWA